MNSRQKGNAAELKIKKYLEEREWLVMKSPRTQSLVFIGNKRKYISKDNDFFNLFDLVAKRNNKTLWIQVKSNFCNASTVKPAILDFSNKYCDNECESCEIWVYQKNKGYAIYQIFEGKWKRINIDF
jgi:hypothetical protein